MGKRIEISPGAMEELKIKNFPHLQQIEIEGIRYSYALFKAFGSFPNGAILKIINRKGEILTLERLYDLEKSK